METQPGPTAQYFDGWYADMARSPVKDEIAQRHLGLPPYLLSTSLLGWEGIAEVIAALRLPAGAVLDTGSADAVLCVDAIQFADPPDAAYRELRRVLAPAGRAVLTCWEPLEAGDERLTSRLRRVDLGAGLAAAGFADVEVCERPSWRAQEKAMWQEAAALEPGDDPALRSFHDEGVRSLEKFGLIRRVMATATAP